MPIVTVDVVVDAGDPPTENLAQLLADAIGLALNSPSGQTWVRLRWTNRNDYAENGAPVQTDQLPVFVTVLERQPPRQSTELEVEVAALTRAVARVVHRPADCVHLEYAPAAAGRVSFGGRLVE